MIRYVFDAVEYNFLCMLFQKVHVLRVLFKCRHCPRQKATWSSSRVYGGHYLVNQKYVVTVQYVYLLYSAKFSRRIILAFFADWHRTAKIKFREILECRIKLMLAESLIHENCFCEIFENDNPRKLSASKIWRYTVVGILPTQIPRGCSLLPLSKFK